jgi:hypothetical protein
MASNLTQQRDELVARAASMTREELVALVTDLADDFVQANRIANTQATAFGWCAEYEERLDGYNRDFKVLEMQGRTPKGARPSVRNVFAARRLVMGQVMSTCERLGVALPDGAWGGVVRDHKALESAHDQLVEKLDS